MKKQLQTSLAILLFLALATHALLQLYSHSRLNSDYSSVVIEEVEYEENLFEADFNYFSFKFIFNDYKLALIHFDEKVVSTASLKISIIEEHSPPYIKFHRLKIDC